jgi:hypothetical protein
MHWQHVCHGHVAYAVSFVMIDCVAALEAYLQQLLSKLQAQHSTAAAHATEAADSSKSIHCVTVRPTAVCNLGTETRFCCQRSVLIDTNEPLDQ